MAIRYHPMQNPGCQALVLRFMPYFLQAKVANSRGFSPSLPNTITRMFNYVAKPLGSSNMYGLPGLNTIYSGKEITIQICKSICSILGDGIVLSALFTEIPTSNLINRLDPAWFAALNTGFDIHFKITAAIAVRCASHVRLLIEQLPPGSSQHAVFGSPLINAIKLKDLDTVRELVRYLLGFDSKTLKTIFSLEISAIAFPIIKAVMTAIDYNQARILDQLARLIRRKFGNIDRDIFNFWIISAARTSNIQVLRSLYRIPVEPNWRLSYDAMSALCKTADYELIYYAFLNANYGHQYDSSRRDPFHIAVSNGIEAAKAVYDTGRHEINDWKICNFRTYWNEEVTALDHAIYRKDSVTIKWLLDQGAEYQRRFPPEWMPGWIYNIIRDQAIKDDPRMSELPSYGQYKDMSKDAKLHFTFELAEWSPS